MTAHEAWKEYVSRQGIILDHKALWLAAWTQALEEFAKKLERDCTCRPYEGCQDCESIIEMLRAAALRPVDADAPTGAV